MVKKLKCEVMLHGNYVHNDFSKSFKNQLTKQITPKIAALILDSTLRSAFVGLLDIHIDEQTYYSLDFVNGKNIMTASLSSHSAWRLCELCIKWYDKKGLPIFPWDDIVENDIVFDVEFEKIELQKLNKYLPELYHPIVTSKKSGLPYDYQIFYVNEGTLIFQYRTEVKESDALMLEAQLTNFIERCKDNTIIADFFFVERSKKIVKFHVDFSSCTLDTVEKLICSFCDQSNIKKITFK